MYYESTVSFNPNGQLMQLEYAKEGVKTSRSTIVISTKEGFLIVFESKDLSYIIDQSMYNKIAQLDRNEVLIVSGISGDTRYLLEYAKQKHREWVLNYGENPTVRTTAKIIADKLHEFTLTGLRPLGTAAICTGIEKVENNIDYVIYYTGPDGALIKTKSICTGIDSDKISTYLSEYYNKNEKFNTLKDAHTFLIDVVFPKTHLKLRPLEKYIFNENGVFNYAEKI